MIFARSNEAKAVWEEWHEFREEARHEAMSKEEFSEIEQEKYDLDTAGITGAQNPRTWKGDPTAPKEFVDPDFDTRDLPWV